MRTLFQAAALCVVASILLCLPALAADTAVTIPWGSALTFVVQIAGAVAAASAAFIAAWVAKMLPAWARPFAGAMLERYLADWIRKGIGYAIQEVEKFDKDKTISIDVGSTALATVLRFLIDNAPGWLLKLAGGPEQIKAKILALFTEHGIVLDQGVTTASVAAKASLQPAIDKIGGDAALKQIFTGKKAA